MADHVVVNDDLDRTVDEMLDIIHRNRTVSQLTAALYTDKPLQEAELWLAPTTR